MVVDWILGAAKAALLALVGVLPEVGEKPEAFEFLWDALGIGNFFVPLYEIYQFLLMALPGMLAAWMIWRFVRLLTPGG